MSQVTLRFTYPTHAFQHKTIAQSDPYGFYQKKSQMPADFGLTFSNTSPAAKDSILKTITKVLNINIPALLTDSEISPATLQSCVNRLDTIIKLLANMAQVSMRTDFLKGRDGEDFIKKYVEISATLKGVMVDYNPTGPSALAWNVRKPKLWHWCRTMLEHTENPLCALVKKENTEFTMKLAKLHDVNTQLIMEIAFGDDVADNLRDKTVTDAILNIPFASKKEREDDLRKILKHRRIGGTGAFTQYYQQAVKVWDDALLQLSDIFGTSVTPELLNVANQQIKSTFIPLPETGAEEILTNPFIEKVYAFEWPLESTSGRARQSERAPFQAVRIIDPHQFAALSSDPKHRLILNIASHFRRIMKSMAFSLQMNTNPHAKNLNSDIINQILPYNMMVNWFRFSEGTLAIPYLSEDTRPSESDLSLLLDIVNQSQLSASLSNSIATLKRELEENDLSNVFFFELNDKLQQTLESRLPNRIAPGNPTTSESDSSDSDISLNEIDTRHSTSSLVRVDFTNFIESRGYRNHFFSHYYNGESTGYPPDLLELLVVRRFAVSQLYNQLYSIFSEAESDVGSFALACENLGKQNISFQTLLPKLKQEIIPSDYEILHLNFTIAERSSEHICLIDAYTKQALTETEIIQGGLDQSDRIYHLMMEKSDGFSSQSLKQATRQYCQHIARDFLFMYLLFKQNSEGEI